MLFGSALGMLAQIRQEPGGPIDRRPSRSSDDDCRMVVPKSGVYDLQAHEQIQQSRRVRSKFTVSIRSHRDERDFTSLSDDASRNPCNMAMYYKIPCIYYDIRERFSGISELSPQSCYYRFPSSHAELDHFNYECANWPSPFSLASQLNVGFIDLDHE